MNHRKIRLISLILIFSLFLSNSLPIFPNIQVLAREVTNEGILYHDQEAWCEGETSNVCSSGVINTTNCTGCLNGYCLLSPTPTVVPNSSRCGHLGNDCCEGEVKCFEGEPKRGFLGLGKCKCSPTWATCINPGWYGCNYDGQKFCHNGNVGICKETLKQTCDSGWKALFGECRHPSMGCANEADCPEISPTPIPTGSPTPTPTRSPCNEDEVGKCRCKNNSIIEQCSHSWSKEEGTMSYWFKKTDCRIYNTWCDIESGQTCSCHPRCPTGTMEQWCTPNSVFCKLGDLAYCDANGCISKWEECLYGCNKDVEPNRCTLLEEAVTVKAGETFHFNDPVLRWSPILNILTRLFYEKLFGGIYSSDSGKPVTKSDVISDLDKYLLQNPGYRAITPESLQFAGILLGALALASPLYSQLVVPHITLGSELPPNIHFYKVTYEQFANLHNAPGDQHLVDEIKLVAKARPNLPILITNQQTLTALHNHNISPEGLALYNVTNSFNLGSNYFPKHSSLILVDYMTPYPGVYAHELGHIVTQLKILDIEFVNTILLRLRIEPSEELITTYKEIVADLYAQKFLVENGLRISGFLRDHLQFQQNLLMEKLAPFIHF